MTAAAREIAFALAPKHAKRLLDGGYITRCPVPSHGRGRGDLNPSLQIADGDTRLLVRCYAKCDVRDVLDELRCRGLLDDRSAETTERTHAAPPKQTSEHKRHQHEKAQWLWSLRQPIKGTIAETYLRAARRYSGPLPPTLAFLKPWREHHPALIAAFALVDEPEPGVLGAPSAHNVGAVHLTLLKTDGSGKAEVAKPKLVVGSPGSMPIVLAPPNDLLGLAITEGIEDALTAHQLTGLGAWAAGSAPFMPKLAAVVPSYVEALTIFAHADKAGEDGARELTTALHQRGIEVAMEGLA